MNWHRFDEAPPEEVQVLCAFMYGDTDFDEYVVAVLRRGSMVFDDAPSTPLTELVIDRSAFWCPITPPEVR